MPSSPDTPIYLDHAATTPTSPKVLEKMLPYMKNLYANPSAPYEAGSRVRSAIEKSRRLIKSLLKGEEGELFFTSGGTEANNWVIQGIIRANDISHVITSSIEHSSILGSIRALEEEGKIACHYLQLDRNGGVDYLDLENLLKRYPKALVSLMHGNNEIGNLTDVVRVASLCKLYKAIFHSDMVQTVGYYPIDLSTSGIDLCTGSSHKLYGPKGVGFLYIKAGIPIAPLLYGGQQERGLRGGTEHVAGIIGMSEALKVLRDAREVHRVHVARLKEYMIQKLEEKIPGIQFYGYCKDPTYSLFNILHVGVPSKDKETLLLNLSMRGIATSSGSACMSGSKRGSHVLRALGIPIEVATVRFSLGFKNTYAEIDQAVDALATIG